MLRNDVLFCFQKQMQRIMLHCFNSVKHKLHCKVGYFDLYGFDFMIDQNMKVRLNFKKGFNQYYFNTNTLFIKENIIYLKNQTNRNHPKNIKKQETKKK